MCKNIKLGDFQFIDHQTDRIYSNFNKNGNVRWFQKGEQGHVSPLAPLSSEVLKRQCQITTPHKPKNIPPDPPPTPDRERETSRINLLFRVLSEERQGCMLLYLSQRDRCHCFTKLFCSAADHSPAHMGGDEQVCANLVSCSLWNKT